jgi:hypothetical protein
MLNGIQVEQAWLTAGIQRAVNAGVMPVYNGLPRYYQYLIPLHILTRTSFPYTFPYTLR